MARRWVWVVRLVAAGLAVWPAAPGWAALVVDNFDDGKKPNALGGDFGSWNKDPDDPTQYCREGFDSGNAFGLAGYALRLDYDVDSPNPAFNGFWSKLERLDLRPYKTLSLYIKGDKAKGYTTQLKLELKNERERGTFLLNGITDEWQKVSVPILEFMGLSDWSRMTELVVVFDDITATKKSGAIYLDEITFE